jgi:glycosyltransferase involved in cell wall biosynthesis
VTRLLLSADPPLPVPPSLYGGVERVVADLVGLLRQRGHEVALVAHRDSAAPADTHFAWPTTGEGGWRDLCANLGLLDRAIAGFRPDLVHSFSRLAYLGRHLVSARPKVMSYQRLPTPRTVRAAAALGRGSLTFTGCSEFICARGLASGGRWIAVPNCIDPARYAFVAAVPDDAPLVFLSRIEEIKGAHSAIHIARRSARRLVLAGNRPAGSIHERYFDERIAPEIDGREVEYVGPVDDVAKGALLGRAAALLLPLAWDEPFGIVMIEALACGTPVVVFRRGAAPEIVRDGIDGFVVNGVDAAVKAVAGIGRLQRLACREGVVARFGVDVVADRYEAVYRAALGG